MRARDGERGRRAVDRRRFMLTLGAAGTAGAFAGIGRAPATAQAPGRAAPAAGSEFSKPAGLRTAAQLDSRFPVSFAEPVPESPRLVMAYVTGHTRDRPIRPITIHATHDKAHTLGGYLRHPADGQLTSETRSVGIRIYKDGQWGSGGGLGQVTHHDRSNSRS